MHLSHQQKHPASRDSKRTGAETYYDRKNRSPAQIYFQKRTRLFCLPEIGKRKGRFRVRRKKGKTQEESCRAQSGRCVRSPALRVARGQASGARPFLGSESEECRSRALTPQVVV